MCTSLLWIHLPLVPNHFTFGWILQAELPTKRKGNHAARWEFITDGGNDFPAFWGYMTRFWITARPVIAPAGVRQPGLRGA
jgi:hypothetical protein